MNNNEDVCPICHEESVYAECMCGEWVIGCSECNIETEPCDSYEEASKQWETMMKNRIKIIIPPQ